MRWSKIKERTADFLCEELCGRLQFYLTSYDKEHRERGRGWVTLDGDEIFSANGAEERQRFYETIVNYPNMAVEEALLSPDPLICALAIADRRVGKRRLQTMKDTNPTHPLVATVLAARLKRDDPSV